MTLFTDAANLVLEQDSGHEQNKGHQGHYHNIKSSCARTLF